VTQAQQPNLSCLGNYERDPCLIPSCPIKVKCREFTELRARPQTQTSEYPDRHEAYLEGLRDARLKCDEAARAATLAENKRILGTIKEWRKEKEAKGKTPEDCVKVWLEEDVLILTLHHIPSSVIGV